MSTQSPFVRALLAFVESEAGGNRSLAARKLGIKRLQLYRYLGGGLPRPALRLRLERSVGAAADQFSSHSEKHGDTHIGSIALQTIHYLKRLVEADLDHGEAASDS